MVHVTQGTLDNADLGRLLLLTVRPRWPATTCWSWPRRGARTPGRCGPGCPTNVRLERFIPHDVLLPHVDVMVTNGGYGGVQQALAHGVPLVVAGDSEDKPEVAARVQWSGAGINLHTGRAVHGHGGPGRATGPDPALLPDPGPGAAGGDRGERPARATSRPGSPTCARRHHRVLDESVRPVGTLSGSAGTSSRANVDGRPGAPVGHTRHPRSTPARIGCCPNHSGMSRVNSRGPVSVIRPIGQGVAEAGIAHPDLGEGAQVGLERHIDFEPRVGQAQIHFVFVDDDPVVAALCRHRGERELDDDATFTEHAGREEATDIPEQQARIEVVGPVGRFVPSAVPRPRVPG